MPCSACSCLSMLGWVLNWNPSLAPVATPTRMNASSSPPRISSERDDLFGPLMAIEGVQIMPNTSGAKTAAEAVRAALLAREICGSPFVKVEIHPNPHHLMPDPIETYEASRQLVKEGFIVLPYIPADPVLAKRLEEVGCAAVMPLGAAIGSGRGLQTRDMIELIVRDSGIPVVVDAGLRDPSEAAAVMEMPGTDRTRSARHAGRCRLDHKP